MKKKFNKKRESRKGRKKFRPNRAYIEKSVEEFLANGGRINKIILDEKSFERFTASNELPGEVDKFLSGE